MKTSERLLARLREHGVALPDDTELLSTRASRSARAAGAWSWYGWSPTRGDLRIGSQTTMSALLAAERISTYSSLGDTHVDLG